MFILNPVHGLDSNRYRTIDGMSSVGVLYCPLRCLPQVEATSLELSPGGNETNMYVFSAISLALSWCFTAVNINLTTTKPRRAKSRKFAKHWVLRG